MTLNETILTVQAILRDTKVPEPNRVVAFPTDEDGYSAEYEQLLIDMTVANYLEENTNSDNLESE